MGAVKREKQKLKAWVRRNSIDDSALSHLLQFTYRFFSKHLVQAFASFLGTVVIAVMVGVGYYGVFFWVTTVVYAVILFFIAIANDHITGKIKDVKTFQDALFELGDVQRAWADWLQESASAFCQVKLSPDGKMSEETEKYVELVLKKIDFQAAAEAVCNSLKTFLSIDHHHADVYVTVFQQIELDGQTFCKMIASSERCDSASFGHPYPIPRYTQDMYGTIEYHSYLFALNKNDISVLVNHDEVERAFRFHDKCVEREGEIEQYLGIPISPKGLGVTFLLQVDTAVPGKFGNDRHSMKEFAKNNIYPFAQFLRMVYEEGRTIEQLINRLKEEKGVGTDNETRGDPA